MLTNCAPEHVPTTGLKLGVVAVEVEPSAATVVPTGSAGARGKREDQDQYSKEPFVFHAIL
jgi:hypothetical protein